MMRPPETNDDREKQLRDELDLVGRRLPLLERCVELAGATLAELQQRLTRLKEGFEKQPRRTANARLDRLSEEVRLLRTQIERLAQGLRKSAENRGDEAHGRS